jgi:hypothetical protein
MNFILFELCREMLAALKDLTLYRDEESAEAADAIIAKAERAGIVVPVEVQSARDESGAQGIL